MSHEKKEPYRHYKGYIYYKIGEGKFVDYDDTLLMDDHIIAAATYECTGENLFVFDLYGKIWVSFAEKETPEALMEEEVIVYESAKTGITYVRLKEEWEGEVMVESELVKRFTKIGYGRTF